MFSKVQMSRYINLLLLFSLLVVGSPVRGVETRHLDLDPSHGKYQVEVVMHAALQPTVPYFLSHVMCSVDGDGFREYVRGHTSKILGYDGEDGYFKARWQVNFDPNYYLHGLSHTLGAVADFNGDGVEEIYTTIVAKDRSDWRFLALDPALEEFTVNAPLPLGTDRRPDGVWDGTYFAIGVVDDADGQGRPGVVLVRSAMYDASLRGVCVVDPFNGEMIWEWLCGPNPDYHDPVVADLEGDGSREIIIFGTSPDNLGGALVNGTSDNEASVFVLDSRGNLIWQQFIGPIYSDGSVVVKDLDADGVQEVISYTSQMAVNQTSKLAIWKGPTGELICQVRQGSGFKGVAVTEGPRPGTSWIFAGSNDGAIDRFVFDGSSLARDLRVLRDESLCRVVGAVDILPEEGPEILVDVGNGALLGVLGRDLKILAVFSEEAGQAKWNPSVWSMNASKNVLALGNFRDQWILGFQRITINYLATLRKVGAGILALVLVGAVFLLGRWRGRREQAAAVVREPRSADREVMYRLWRQLDDIKHEKMLEASRGLRRLVWLLDAYATDLGASGDLGDRIRQLMQDYEDVVNPRLENILQMAGSEGFEKQTVAATTAALGALTLRLHELTAADLDLAKVTEGRDGMKEELGQVEQGLLSLWDSVRSYFTTDPVRLLKGMILVREGELARSGIEAEVLVAETVADSLCLIDSGDLRYVLDNLVDNAARAMGNSDERRLLLRIERNNSEITVRVSDTGPGVPGEIRDMIFTGRFSTRQGGGSGLFRSRDILHRWGGEINLADARAEQGATFVVRLRAARKAEPAASAEASA